ncbi:hypothetical protein EVA_20573 [gut metagenome]|uniref:Uncharacterized protein n=1 Tax=gut metagenome TaxID=749906 RepID=J9BUS0_9ZZZZ
MGWWWTNQEEHPDGWYGYPDHCYDRSGYLWSGEAYSGYGSLYPCIVPGIYQDKFQLPRKEEL